MGKQNSFIHLSWVAFKDYFHCFTLLFVFLISCLVYKISKNDEKCQ